MIVKVIWQRIKFGGLAVRFETAKLIKSNNIIVAHNP